MLGLPDVIRACLFDLDGVLTDTAAVHRRAWARTFDPLLAERGEPPFSEADYLAYVDGKPRSDGVRDFLASRGIHLPEGQAGDPESAVTVAGVGNRKNALLVSFIHTDGVTVYDGSLEYLRRAVAAGLRRVVVSSSANTAEVLRVTGLGALVEGRVDGLTLRAEHLRGKPAPDSFLAAARLIGVAPEHAAVFEDAIAGVQAARDGGFGYVVGVDRIGDGHADALRAHGATVVVGDLRELL